MLKKEKSRRNTEKGILEALKSAEQMWSEEELTRPRVEIWPDPADDWAEWVRPHERKKMVNPIDICEMALGMRGSPLCPIGYH